MKGIHYLGTVLNVYRQALDAYLRAPTDYRVNPAWISELDKISHRPYGTGFYFSAPPRDAAILKGHNAPGSIFLGKVVDRTEASQTCIDVRNQFHPGVDVELIRPGRRTQPDRVTAIFDADHQPLEIAQPGMRVLVELRHAGHPLDLIRRLDSPQAA